MSKFPLTAGGAEQLKKDLAQMKDVERPQIVQAIAEARAHGDLKENAEYHAAREQQGFLEAKIAKIESVLSNAQVIDIKKLEDTGKVIFGTTVTIVDIEDDSESTYTIVGDIEADISHNKISVNSPIAKALIGKEAGDEVKIQVPAGIKEMEILEVIY